MSILDARGCLTGEGLAAVAKAPLGQAPAEAAAHLAACPRCQERVLAAEAEASGAALRRQAKPFRNVALFGLVLVLTLLMLGITLVVLRGR